MAELTSDPGTSYDLPAKKTVAILPRINVHIYLGEKMKLAVLLVVSIRSYSKDKKHMQFTREDWF